MESLKRIKTRWEAEKEAVREQTSREFVELEYPRLKKRWEAEWTGRANGSTPTSIENTYEAVKSTPLPLATTPTPIRVKMEPPCNRTYCIATRENAKNKPLGRQNIEKAHTGGVKIEPGSPPAQLIPLMGTKTLRCQHPNCEAPELVISRSTNQYMETAKKRLHVEQAHLGKDEGVMLCCPLGGEGGCTRVLNPAGFQNLRSFKSHVINVGCSQCGGVFLVHVVY